MPVITLVLSLLFSGLFASTTTTDTHKTAAGTETTTTNTEKGGGSPDFIISEFEQP